MIADLIAERQLLADAKPDNSEFISRLFHVYGRMILNVAFRILRDRSLAEDVLQDTFLRFFQIRDRADETRNLPGLLRKIAVNLSIDILRKRGRERPLEVDDKGGQCAAPDPNPPLTMVNDWESLLVRELLERLPLIDRAVLELRYGEQLSYEEISQALDLSVPAVAQRIRRSKDALRRDFKLGKRRQP